MVNGCDGGGVAIAFLGRGFGRYPRSGPDRAVDGRVRNLGTEFRQAVEAYQGVHGKTVKGPDGSTHEINRLSLCGEPRPDKAKQLAEELILRERVKFLTGLELSPMRRRWATLAAGQDFRLS